LSLFFITCNSVFFRYLRQTLCVNISLLFSLDLLSFLDNLFLVSCANIIRNYLPSITCACWETSNSFLEKFEFFLCPVTFNVLGFFLLSFFSFFSFFLLFNFEELSFLVNHHQEFVNKLIFICSLYTFNFFYKSFKVSLNWIFLNELINIKSIVVSPWHFFGTVNGQSFDCSSINFSFLLFDKFSIDFFLFFSIY
jgi:hypothetical protein